jgi:hypothetical protein
MPRARRLQPPRERLSAPSVIDAVSEFGSVYRFAVFASNDPSPAAAPSLVPRNGGQGRVDGLKVEPIWLEAADPRLHLLELGVPRVEENLE